MLTVKNQTYLGIEMGVLLESNVLLIIRIAYDDLLVHVCCSQLNDVADFLSPNYNYINIQ